MDIKAKIEELVKKAQTDKNFAADFAANPIKAITDAVGISLPDDQLNAIVAGVKTKLNLDKAGGLLGSAAKKLF